MSSIISAEFGYYPHPVDVTDKRFSLKTLPNFSESVEHINGDTNIIRDWIYPGAQQIQLMGHGIKTMPYSVRVFGLPKTHILTLNECKRQNELEFVVWCLSFFWGMRLTTTEAGFLDAATIKPNKLVDFVLTPANTISIINLALNFINDKKNDFALSRIPAVIHALFLAQYPHALSFETFQYLYVAIDGCFKILWEEKGLKSRQPPHSDRIRWMCEEFSIPVPSWAIGKDGIASLRNENFHEAIFLGQPLGFSSFNRAHEHNLPKSLILQMEALTCRFLAAILGVKDKTYITSNINTRQYLSLSLKSK